MNWLLGALAVGLAAALYVLQLLQTRLEEGEAALAAARRERVAAVTALASCRERAADDDALLHTALASTPCPPDGPNPARSGDEATPEASRAEERVQTLLASRLATAAEGGRLDLDAATQREVLDQLLTLRDLRSQPLDAERDPVGAQRHAESVHDAESTIQRLTGMGVGDLLDALEPGGGVRAPESAPIVEGNVRKRFADEISRQLGVTEPGSVEVLEGDEWRTDR